MNWVIWTLVIMAVLPISWAIMKTLMPAERYIKFVCWFSRRYWDIHDYHYKNGGDDEPMHFYDYKCWNCGKKFTI